MKLGMAQVTLAQAAGTSKRSQAAETSTRPSKEAADAERTSRACKEFESILIYHMLSTMRRAFKSEEDTGLGFGGDIFKSMMDEQLSIALAKAGGIGLSELLERGLGLETDGAKPGPTAVDPVVRPVVRRSRPAQPATAPAEGTAVAEPGAGGGETVQSGAVERGAAEAGAAKKSSWAQSVADKLKPYERTITAAAKVFGVDADLIRAVIMQESAGDRRAVSQKGAKGLMQLMDGTAGDLGVTDPFDPAQNIFGGARLLSRLLGVFDGNLRLALASYNAGLGAVRKYGGVPPYKETQDYIERVTDNLASLRAQSEDGG